MEANRVALFLRDRGRKFNIPEREDLFQRQIKVLDRDYSLVSEWNSFNSALDAEFGGDLEKFNRIRENVSTGLLEYYSLHKVNSQAQEFIAQNNLEETIKIQEDPIPGHTYLKVDLEHAFNQVLDYYRFVPDTEVELIARYAEGSELLAKEKFPRILSFTLFNKSAFAVLVEQLLLKAKANVEHPLFKELETWGIPIVRKDLDDLVYDVTGYEETFSSFVGPQVSNEVKLHVSMFRQDCMVFYYDYALHIIPVQIDYTTGQKEFGDYKTREFQVQLACIDQGWPITEKDLWYQDRDGLHRYNKPIRQVLLGPENVVE